MIDTEFEWVFAQLMIKEDLEIEDIFITEDEYIIYPTGWLMERLDWASWRIEITRWEEEKSAPFELTLVARIIEKEDKAFMNDSLKKCLQLALAWQLGYEWDEKEKQFVRRGVKSELA